MACCVELKLLRQSKKKRKRLSTLKRIPVPYSLALRFILETDCCHEWELRCVVKMPFCNLLCILLSDS